MQTVRWNRKSVALAGLILVGFYLVISASRQTFEAERTLPNVKPAAVWNFVADFSNMRSLNPTMYDIG